MKQFLKSLKLISALLLFCVKVNAQKDSVRTNELSVNTSLALPIYYDANIRYTNGITSIKPNYIPSFVVGLQYKIPCGFLAEFQFQPYHFNYKTPLITYQGSSSQLGIGYNSYYEIFSYTQNRYSLGIGYKFWKKRIKFSAIVGVSMFSGTSKNTAYSSYEYKDFDKNGNQIDEGAVLVKVSKIAPYLNIGLEYNFLKRLSAIVNVNYSLLYYGVGYIDYSSGGYGFQYINLLAVNIGLKYNIISKGRKVKSK